MKILLMVCAFTAFTAWAQTNSVSFKAITLNSWMIPFLRQDSLPRANIIGEGMRDKGYQVALLQEMFSPYYLKLAHRRFTEDQVGLRPIFPPLVNSGLAVFSKFPVVKKAFKAFDACLGFQCLAEKGIQFRRIKVSGIEIDVYNVHLQPFQKRASIREKQIKELNAFIAKHSGSERPILLGGDFNVIAESREYPMLLSFLEGFKDVWSLANPERPGYSWDPNINPYAKPDPEEDFVKQRVDYLFVRDGQAYEWLVKGAELEFTAPKPLGFGKYFASDHFGVGAFLELHKL